MKLWVLKSQGTEVRLGFASGLSHQRFSSSHHPIFVGISLVHNVENFFMKQPRLQVFLLCSAKEFPVHTHHLPFVDFDMFLVTIGHCEDLQLIRRLWIEVDELIGQDFDDEIIGVWDQDIFWLNHSVWFGNQ